MNEQPEILELQEEVFLSVKYALESNHFKSRFQPVKICRRKDRLNGDDCGGHAFSLVLKAGQPDSRDHFLMIAIDCLDEEEYLTAGLVQSFYERLAKIGRPVKGLLVTSGALRKDAFKMAGSLGIGLVRLLPPGQVLWLNQNMSPLSFREYDRIDPNDFTSALFDPAYVGQNRAFYAWSDHHLFGDWLSLLAHYLQ